MNVVHMPLELTLRVSWRERDQHTGRIANDKDLRVLGVSAVIWLRYFQFSERPPELHQSSRTYLLRGDNQYPVSLQGFLEHLIGGGLDGRPQIDSIDPSTNHILSRSNPDLIHV